MDNGFYTLNGKGETVYFSESFELLDTESSDTIETEIDPYYEERYYASYETDRIDSCDEFLFLQISSIRSL